MENLKVKDRMGSDLCIGIASHNDSYEIVALEHGKTSAVMKFPASRMGIEAIKGFLSNYGNHIRVAVTGVAAISVAMALGNTPRRETYIVSPSIANQAAALAHYAEHMV